MCVCPPTSYVSSYYYGSSNEARVCRTWLPNTHTNHTRSCTTRKNQNIVGDLLVTGHVHQKRTCEYMLTTIRTHITVAPVLCEGKQRHSQMWGGLYVLRNFVLRESAKGELHTSP